MSLKKEEIENLSRLLISADDKNIDIAFAILDGISDKEVVAELASEFFALYKIGKECPNTSFYSEIYKNINREHIDRFESILLSIDNQDVQDAVKSKKGFIFGTSASSHLKKMTKNTILDAKKIALIIFNKCNLGLDFLVSTLSDDELRPIIQKFIKGNKLVITRQKITKIPKFIFELPDIEIVNLNNNQIKTIPKGIEKMVNLKHLFLAWNPLKKIHPNISKLTKLQYLDLQATNIQDKELLSSSTQAEINWTTNPKNPSVKTPALND